MMNNFINCIDHMGLMGVGTNIPSTLSGGPVFVPSIEDIIGSGTGGHSFDEVDLFWEYELQKLGIDLSSLSHSLLGGGGGGGFFPLGGFGTGMLGGGVRNYIVINTRGEKIGGVDDGDNSIYVSWSGVWNEKMGKHGDGMYKVGKMFPFGIIDYYEMPNGERVPGMYDGQYVETISLSIGLQANVGVCGVNVASVDLMSLSKKRAFDNINCEVIGLDGEARFHSLGVSVGILGCDYSIKMDGDTRYVPGTQTPYFPIGTDGHFTFSFSIGVGGVLTWSISGNLYYSL